MKTSDLIFVGIKGKVVALDRATGVQVWATHLKGVDLVNVVVQNGMVLAMCYGELFCLDPLTGDAIWHNPLKGYGIGLATIAMEQSPANMPLIMAEQRRREQQAAAGAAAA
jgi:outer membrane protein assembly factor BamB